MINKSKTPKYIEVEKTKAISNGRFHICISCGDKIEIGNFKGKFNCPACGWLNEIK